MKHLKNKNEMAYYILFGDMISELLVNETVQNAMDIQILSEHEHDIFVEGLVNIGVQNVMDERFKKLVEKIYPTYSKQIKKEQFEDWLFDYIYNKPQEETFQEFISKFK